jgi:hypothetical protein
MFEILGDLLNGIIDNPFDPNGLVGGPSMQSEFKYSLFDMSGGKNGTGKLIKSFDTDFDPLLTLCDLSTFIR